jgi:pimeloyl-ACP methyl ester carboxylesterase
MLRVSLLIGGVAATLSCLGARARAQPQAQGRGAIQDARFVDVDGHAMRVLVRGLETRVQGSPVIVFEAGATNSLEAWSGVLPRLAGDAPVVAYDRAGLGQSEWDDQAPTPRHVTARLRTLLAQLDAGPPYVLVGHSWGAVLMRYFAGYHPSEVAGVVFVDPGPIITQTLAERIAPFDSVGAGQAGYDAFWSAFESIFAQSPPAIRAEFEVFRGLMEVKVGERDLRPMPGVPVVVLAAAKYLPLPPTLRLPFDPEAQFEFDVRHRIRMLQEWALASPRGTLVVSNTTTHVIPREEPELIVWAIERVLVQAGWR